MKLIIAILLLLPALYCYNYLIISPIFGYSHMKFMGKMADILADAGHNVTFLQPIVYDYYANKKVVKNANIEVVNYEMDAEGKAAASDASVFKFFWEARPTGSPLTTARNAASRLFHEFEHMCRKMLTDKQLHNWILSKNFDSHVSEAFDFCGLFLGDFLQLKAPIPLYTGVRCAPAAFAVGEPIPLNYFPTQGSKYGGEATAFDRLNDMVGLMAYHNQFGLLFDKQYEQAFALTGGKVRSWQEILQSATFFLTNSNPYLSFSIPTISKVIQVGGCTIEPAKSTRLDAHWEAVLAVRKDTILVSFGTVIQSSDMPDRFKTGLIDTFRRMPETTFIWKYEEEDEGLSRRLPANVVLSKWVPQPALLADSRVRIFVTHGGLGSTMEVAYAGVPSVMVPIFSDQGVNANMLARHGGAVVFDKFDLSDAEKLTETFRRILDSPDYKKHADRLSDILRHQPTDPKHVLLSHCEFAARFGEVPTLEPHANKYNFIQFYCLDTLGLILSVFFVIVLIVYKFSVFLYNRAFGALKEKRE